MATQESVRDLCGDHWPLIPSSGARLDWTKLFRSFACPMHAVGVVGAT